VFHAACGKGLPGMAHFRGDTMTMAGRIAYIRRVAALAVRHPVETWDRSMGLSEIRRFRPSPGSSPLEPSMQWEDELHRRIGAPWPCPALADFDSLWSRMSDELPEADARLDADPAVARAVFCCVRHLALTTVVETGVARGITSRVILEALPPKGGQLWSVDLPPAKEGWSDQSQVAVPQRLRSNWHYVRGASSRRLEDVLRRVGQVDLFVQDSLHTPKTVLLECGHAWRALRRGGVLVVDDEDSGVGFAQFVKEVAPSWFTVAPHALKKSTFALAIR